MGNTDSVFASLIFGEEVEDTAFEIESEKTSAVVGALIWGEEAQENVLPEKTAHSLPPLPSKYAHLEKLRLPETWKEFDNLEYLELVERSACVFKLLVGNTPGGLRQFITFKTLLEWPAVVTVRDECFARRAWIRIVGDTKKKTDFATFVRLMDFFEEEAGSSSDSEMGESHDLARRATGPIPMAKTSTKGSRRRTAHMNGDYSSNDESTDEEGREGGGGGSGRNTGRFQVVDRVPTPVAAIGASLLPPISQGAQTYVQDGREFEQGSAQYPTGVALKKMAKKKARMKDVINLDALQPVTGLEVGDVSDGEENSQAIIPSTSRNENADEPANILAALFWNSWS